MSVQFFSLLTHEQSSETIPRAANAPVMDVDYFIKSAQTLEEAGFDRVLVAHHSSNPDGLLLASRAAQSTQKLNFMVAHRPGFISPTYAARMWATFDNLYGGRAGIHVISGGSDAEQRADGDYLNHAERYRRTDHWLDIFKKTLTSAQPFDHENGSFKVTQAFSKLKPLQAPYPPIFFGGASEDAIAVGARHADYWALFAETLEQTREMIARIRDSAERAGRDRNAIKFCLSLRPIMADTEDAAWSKAHAIAERIKELQKNKPAAVGGGKPQAVSGERLRSLADEGEVLDKRLWTGVAKLTGAAGSSTCLVGTPDQIAESMEDYYREGVSIFLIRGFDPLPDAQEYGRKLLPLVKRRIAALGPVSATPAAAASAAAATPAHA